MLFAIGRNLAIVATTMFVVCLSAIIWPIDDDRPESQLAETGAKLAYAYDGTLLVGAAMEGHGFGDDHVVIAARVPTLQRMSLAESFVTKRGIQSLQSLPKLMFLNLRQTRWTLEAIDDIAHLSSLKELNLEGCEWLRDEHLTQLSSLPNLELLNVSATSLTPGAFERLSEFPSLKHIALNHCSQFDDSVVDALVDFLQKRPIHLSLSWTEITRDGLARLHDCLPNASVDLRPETMVGLRELGDRGQFMTNTRNEIIGFRYRHYPEGYIGEPHQGDLIRISAVPGLRRLNLDQTIMSDRLLLEINPMPQLETLRMSSTLITDSGLQVLCRFPNLKSLLIMDADLDGSGLENLRHVPQLRTLHVQTRRGDEILSHISGLRELRSLSIHSPLTDAGMELLARMENLESLELIQTHVGGKGIEKLVDLPKLNDLIFVGGPVGDSDIETLAQLKAVNRIILAQTQMTQVGRNRLVAMARDKGVLWSNVDVPQPDPVR